MSRIRANIERYFGKLGKQVVRFRWFILILTLGLTGFMMSRLPLLTFDMSTEAFLHEKDPSIIRYNSFREQYGRDEMIVLMIKPKNVFDLDFLKKLQRFHSELEDKVPYLDDITSLINARVTKGTQDELIVEDLLENFPETESDLERIKSIVTQNPLYQNLLISEDGTLTTIILKSDAYSIDESAGDLSGFNGESDFSDGAVDSGKDLPSKPAKVLSNEENSEMVRVVREIMSRYNSEDFPIYLSGSPVVTDYLKSTMQKDMKKFTLLALLTISVFLFILFRRATGVILPLITVILSVIFTFALMQLTDTPIKLPLVILPSFLLAIGVGASVHLMTIFFKYLDSHDKSDAIAKALSHSGLPIVMTSITTAAGLASFSQAQIAPVADLGVFASFGVFISLCFTLLLLPALISLIPVKLKQDSEEQKKSNLMDRCLVFIGDFSVDNRWKVTVISLVIICFGVAGIFKLNITHHVLHWFPVGTEIRDNTELIDNKMKGTLAIEVVFDTNQENGLYEPDVLNKIEQLGERLVLYQSTAKGISVSKTISLVDIIKEINKAMHEDDPEEYKIPQDRRLIAQEFFLFQNSGTDDLEDMVDSQFSKTHMTVKVPWADSVTYLGFFNYLHTNIEKIFDDTVSISVTGIAEMLMSTVIAMMNSTIISYAIAIVIITLLMIVLIGRFRIGLLSMIPNLTPIILTLGIMGWTGINLDMFSMLIGSIAIGLAVDDTIHFFHNFRKYFEKSGNVKQAVRETLTTAGRAMLVTSLVLATGFWLFMFATMQNLFYFGLLTGITLIFAFLADIILAPALLAIVTKSTDSNPVSQFTNPIEEKTLKSNLTK
ncbi:MMPL family transporter [bacterium]|nr:MMPL family transporter [bacterium]